LDSDDEIINDSDHEADEHSGEGTEQNVDRVEIQTDSNLLVWERIETIEDEIAIEQGKKIVAAYSDKHAEYIDPLWFLLASVSRLLSKCTRTYRKQCMCLLNDGFLILFRLTEVVFNQMVLFVLPVNGLCVMELI
jgi:hypothetical protein